MPYLLGVPMTDVLDEVVVVEADQGGVSDDLLLACYWLSLAHRRAPRRR